MKKILLALIAAIAIHILFFSPSYEFKVVKKYPSGYKCAFVSVLTGYPWPIGTGIVSMKTPQVMEYTIHRQNIFEYEPNIVIKADIFYEDSCKFWFGIDNGEAVQQYILAYSKNLYSIKKVRAI